MSDHDNLMRPDLKGKALKRFRAKNPSVFAKAQGDVSTTRQLANIEVRAEQLKERAKAHHIANKDVWTAREAIELWKNHVRKTSKVPAETTVQGVSADNLMWKARQEVQARGLQRLSRINGIKTRMQNTIIRIKETQSPQQVIKNKSGPKEKQRNKIRQGSPSQ